MIPIALLWFVLSHRSTITELSNAGGSIEVDPEAARKARSHWFLYGTYKSRLCYWES